MFGHTDMLYGMQSISISWCNSYQKILHVYENFDVHKIPMVILRQEFMSVQEGVYMIIALWGWFSLDVLPVTCCEHGPPSIATVHFSKFSIATNILFN